MELDGPWSDWIDTRLQGLYNQSLFRTLRPTVTIRSSVKTLMAESDLLAWASESVSLPSNSSSFSPSHSSAPSFYGYHGVPPPSSQWAARRLMPLTLFSLNDYLGLASHPNVSGAMALAARHAGLGPRSSALVGGYSHSHRQLEEGLALLKGTEDALLFPTGFAANTALLGSLTSLPDVVVFSDELNHASIVDGAVLSTRNRSQCGAGEAVMDNNSISINRACHGFNNQNNRSSSSSLCNHNKRLFVYRHNDMEHLDQLLAAVPQGTRKLVVTDSIFSMDGDIADLRGLTALRRRHGFLLAVDEAHATLVCGAHGGGAAEALGVADQVDLHVGTLSKAFGALGGFIATSKQLRDVLVNGGRPLIYSTALPVPVVEAAAAAMDVAAKDTWRRQHVWRLSSRLGNALQVPALSPIVPLVIGPQTAALDLSRRLLTWGMSHPSGGSEGGFHVPAIRPPTVPEGTCRLRISLSAAHTNADVDALIGAIKAGMDELNSSIVRQGDHAPLRFINLPHLENPVVRLPGPGGLSEDYILNQNGTLSQGLILETRKKLAAERKLREKQDFEGGTAKDGVSIGGKTPIPQSNVKSRSAEVFKSTVGSKL
mmetsp:Transcript_33223/g.60048  ORF Transcript_33223/g.60048 Transcript_33223/m.60048 type:complete len:599 (-) Transcript_33223:73-1869(-)|eukprot:CAMPEP_0175045458 /NCGR_PEP_ID=MMETSP0052_2-20121109/4436_1 /TAXON_ID=51329 ORGANISM="Polytomella parva, Strain SAG 63-3" /NCGR_SAMPLE_ID=MMETSP0052_2 /ASSEMBLY_ACC=CAM_ASM_000194 /LENGTH=598 /DNA_ID=CAMNT_0016308995 /DNA_START=554 /DNA_END=2350 /DNA_ORIENTATION=-